MDWLFLGLLAIPLGLAIWFAYKAIKLRGDHEGNQVS